MPLHTVCNVFSQFLLNDPVVMAPTRRGQVLIPFASSHELVNCIVYSLQPLLRMTQNRREKILTLPTFSLNYFGAQGRSSPNSCRIFKNS